MYKEEEEEEEEERGRGTGDLCCEVKAGERKQV